MKPTINEPLMTLQEVAKVLNVSESTVNRMANDSEIIGRKVRGQWRFSRAALEAFLSQPSEPAKVA